jgi:hypothetical protein
VVGYLCRRRDWSIGRASRQTGQEKSGAILLALPSVDRLANTLTAATDKAFPLRRLCAEQMSFSYVPGLAIND